MMKGLIFPGMAAALLSAQGAFAALFSDGTYAIAPANGKNNYLAASLYANITLSKSTHSWKIAPSDGRWTIQSIEDDRFLGYGEGSGPDNEALLTYDPVEWEIQQQDHRDRTWRIVKPQSRDHPNYGDISVLTYHESEHGSIGGLDDGFNFPLDHNLNVQDLAIDRSDLIQYWQFVLV